MIHVTTEIQHNSLLILCWWNMDASKNSKIVSETKLDQKFKYFGVEIVVHHDVQSEN